MTIEISSLMDGLGDETLALTDPGITDPERVLALARAQGGARPRKRARKRARKTGRILLVAAALTALLTVTAYGVYTHFVADYVLGPAEGPAAARLSLVGYQGTPEYQAYVEWDAMRERWREENSARRAQLGLTDNSTWHETPDEYFFYYDAVTQAQAEELDALMEKYGLTLHRHRSTLPRRGDYDMLGLESLCELLDMDIFIHDLCDAYGGYVYDDGSFKLEASAADDWDGPESFTMFLSAKGSFTAITATLPLEYEEWRYTVDGRELTLALADTGGVILGELPGAYVELASRAKSREALEALADSVDFAALAARFDGTPLDLTDGMAAMDEAYNAWLEGYIAAHDPHPEAADLPQFDDEAQALDYALGRLGDWDWRTPPAGYAPVWRKGICQPVKVWQPDAGSVDAYALFVSGYYLDQAAGKGLSLIYMRPYADTALTESVCSWEMEAERQMEPEGNGFDLDGCPALYTPARYGVEKQSVLFWLDGERDLVFQLSVQGEQTPRETLEAYARALMADMDGQG